MMLVVKVVIVVITVRVVRVRDLGSFAFTHVLYVKVVTSIRVSDQIVLTCRGSDLIFDLPYTPEESGGVKRRRMSYL